MTVLCIFLLIALWNGFSRNSLNCNRVWGQTVTTDSNHWVKIIPQNNNKMFCWNKGSNREFKCCLNKVCLEWFLNQNQGVDLFCDCAYLVHLHIKISVVLINSWLWVYFSYEIPGIIAYSVLSLNLKVLMFCFVLFFKTLSSLIIQTQFKTVVVSLWPPS